MLVRFTLLVAALHLWALASQAQSGYAKGRYTLTEGSVVEGMLWFHPTTADEPAKLVQLKGSRTLKFSPDQLVSFTIKGRSYQKVGGFRVPALEDSVLVNANYDFVEVVDTGRVSVFKYRYVLIGEPTPPAVMSVPNGTPMSIPSGTNGAGEHTVYLFRARGTKKLVAYPIQIHYGDISFDKQAKQASRDAKQARLAAVAALCADDPTLQQRIAAKPMPADELVAAVQAYNQRFRPKKP